MHIYWSFNGSLRERDRERQRDTESDRERQIEIERNWIIDKMLENISLKRELLVSSLNMSR